MNSRKIFLVVNWAAILLLVVQPAGATNSPVDGSTLWNIKVKYTDRQGVDWFQPLPGQFTNGCEAFRQWRGDGSDVKCGSPNKIDKTSPAYRACLELGLELPERSDWDRLAREFDHEDHPLGVALTDKGQRDLTAKLGLAKGLVEFASKTIGQPNDPMERIFAFAFVPEWRADAIVKLLKVRGVDPDPTNYSALSRYVPQSVICIRRPGV